MTIETELKLGIRRGDLPRLRAHPLLATARHHPPVRVDNTYYDTEDEALARHGIALRLRQMRNFFATLLLAQGTPMLVAGDEFARTQHGNNNAYCHDSELIGTTGVF